MEPTTSIGLYLSRQRAAAVRLSDKEPGALGDAMEIVPLDGDAAQTIALAAAQKIRQWGGAEQVFVALDSSCYTQYALQSEFADARQVESTIKFDAEEAAATDAMNLAVAFSITGPLPTGSEVIAFTVDRQTATDILLDLQEGGVDPVMLEPDAVCLARVLERTLRLSEHPDTLFILLTDRTCYLVGPVKTGFAPKLRSFLLPDSAHRTATLIREVLLSLTGWDEAHPLKKVVFLESAEGIDKQKLAERTGLEVRIESAIAKLSFASGGGRSLPSGELLIAAGACLAAIDKGHSADFRRDFMPYQGKRRAMEASLRIASISLAVFLAAIAMFFQAKTYRYNSYTRAVKAKLAEEYRGMMYGVNPPTAEAVNSRLRRTLVNAKRAQEGLGTGDDKSVPARLTFLFEAINNTPASVDVAIQQIAITERSMRVKGDTNSRKSTLELFDAIKKHPKLKLGSERLGMVGARDTFEFTLEPGQ